MKKRRFQISIEGNIASGKSSVIEYLRKRFSEFKLKAPDCHEEWSKRKIKQEKTVLSNKSHSINEIIPVASNNNLNFEKKHFFEQPNVHLKLILEPVSLWQNLNGNNLLDLMYKDPKRWSLAFHSYVQLTTLQNHLELRKSSNLNQFEENFYNINIMERSLYSAKYCFVENLYKSQLLETVEYEILDKWFTWMTGNNECDLDIIFYLRTSPEICLQRLQQRARAEETSQVSLEYLKNLHNYHENWLTSCNNVTNSGNKYNSPMYKPNSVIIIDADKSIEEVFEIIDYETKKFVYAANNYEN